MHTRNVVPTHQRAARTSPGPCIGRLPRTTPLALRQPKRSVAVRSATDDTLTADVVIVGAGIVGLFAAQELLRHKLSVMMVERKGLCAGATGAGQGYLWMAHRAPGSVGWALAARSMALWRRLVEADPDFRAAVEWQECGSLLVATTAAESAALSERQMALNAVGVRATFLDPGRLLTTEPGLVPPQGGAGLLLQSDLQINGRAAAHALLARCRASADFRDLMGPEGEVLGVELVGGEEGGHVVRTPGRLIQARHALVLAAGVWTGSLLAGATGDAGWASLLQPRRGHLLELPRPSGMPPVVHGMMEMSYTKHYATAAAAHGPFSTAGVTPADITFTATTSASGSLLIGSSREFSGWDTTPSPAIVSAILARSAQFLPGLRPAAEAAAAAAEAEAAAPPPQASPTAAPDSGPLAGLSVRVGLRPYAVGGLPMVGPILDTPGLFVAAGHEGSGLCLGPATAELLTRHICRHIAESSQGSGGASTNAGSMDTRSFQDLLPDARRRAAAAIASA